VIWNTLKFTHVTCMRKTFLCKKELQLEVSITLLVKSFSTINSWVDRRVIMFVGIYADFGFLIEAKILNLMTFLQSFRRSKHLLKQ
jgi:hypothetical protein